MASGTSKEFQVQLGGLAAIFGFVFMGICSERTVGEGSASQTRSQGTRTLPPACPKILM